MRERERERKGEEEMNISVVMHYTHMQSFSMKSKAIRMKVWEVR